MVDPVPKKSRRVLITFAAILIVQALAVVAYQWVESNRSLPQPDDRFDYERLTGSLRLPPAQLLRRDGEQVLSSELVGGLVLVHFWATWCPPCREELPDLLRFADEEPRLQVLAVTVNEDWRAIDAFFNGSVPRQVVREAQSRLVPAFGVGALPDTYLLHRGKAVMRFSGPRSWRTPSARAALAPYLVP